ncbi:hypothetical protein BGZ59_005219 [Podila verticillata]|nr:hypothetical protein BGZ59_005219 [Podila verticillata]KFH73724.1 hypothetical protein MVEG_00938 [Podila verticillata NRRL 6337]
MTSTHRTFFRSSAASSRSTSPSPPPVFPYPNMVNPQDPPPYSRRSNHPGPNQFSANVNSPNTNSLSSSNFYSVSSSNAAVRPSTLATVTAMVTGRGGNGNEMGPPPNSRHHHSLSNSSSQSDLPSALVDKQFIYHPSSSSPSSRLRSLRRRLFSRRALGYYLILALIAVFSLFYLRPSSSFWSSSHSVNHHSTNHDRHRYDYDYPLDKERQRAQEIERQKAYERENREWQEEQERNPGHDSGSSEKNLDTDKDDDGPIGTGHGTGVTKTGALDPESIVLYRILGNDLPPRHRPGQTLSNVRFILEHEPEFNKTRKLWVLNRIVDPQAEASLIQLLNHHRQEYITIPFVEKEYLKQDFRLEDFPEPDFFSSDDYSDFTKVAKLRVLDYTYHDKNNYAMNNNGGRNIAIQHGKTNVDARWIFAFDGNSFLTQNAMGEIKQAITDHGNDVKYLVVPMARLVDNSQLLKGVDIRPNSKEEPQIIFRNDASEAYNPDMRYGRRSKLELLWRLGALERSKVSKPSVKWELKERDPIPNKAEFKIVGWVFRLFSGKRSQEENTRQSAAIRAYNRLLAIQDLIDGIDERIARKTFGSHDLLIYKDSVLMANRQKYWVGEPGVTNMVHELQSKACHVLSTRANLLKKASAEDLILYPADAQGKPDVPGAKAPLSEEAASKVITLQGLYNEVTTLTLAHYFTGNETFARAAANIVRTTLLQEHDQHVANHPATEDTEYLLDHGYSFPALNRLPRVIPKKEGTLNARPLLTIPKDLLKADTMPAFLDAIRMLHRIHVLTQNEYIQLTLVFSTWLEHLVNSPEGILYAKQGDHRSSFMDLHVAALAAVTDDVRLFLRVVNRCRMRVGRQFMVVQDGKIKMPFENAFATRQSMAKLLQPGGAAADVTGQELAGMYIDEENDDLDLVMDQSVSRPRDLGSLIKDTIMSDKGKSPKYTSEEKSNDSDGIYEEEDITGDNDLAAATAAKAKQPKEKDEETMLASSTPPMVPEGSAEPIVSVSEMTEQYSTLNLQYWTLLTRMVDNAGMASAPDLWRHRSKRGYRLGDVVRNFVRQDHNRSSGIRKVTVDALLYTARTSYDNVPPRALLTSDDSTLQRQKTGSSTTKPHNPANEGILEWGTLGLEANIFEALARDEQDLKDSLGGSLPGTGVPPFWMLGVVE